MGRNNHSYIRERKITPVSGMREFLGDTAFRTFMVAALLFSFLHQRVISVELAGGGGGIWCGLGIPALLCLAISALLAFFGAKARILPALVPIIGLGGMGASAVMFFVIILSRMRFSGGLLGIIQEITMLAFLTAWIVCILLLILTGIGLKTAPVAGIPAAVASITALALFIIRAMYIFSSLITALSRDLLLPDGEMASEIQWVLRSVQPGSESAREVYSARLMDSVGIALLMMTCITLAFRFNGFFAEQAVMMNNAREIPPPSRRQTIYDGYDEYTADAPARENEGEYTLTSEGYYVEKKKTDRGKFTRRERSEKPRENRAEQSPAPSEETSADSAPQTIPDTGEYYDDYVPGEGWSSFLQRTAPAEQTPTVEKSATAEPTTAERKRVKPVQTSKPAVDPSDPDIWNQYSD